MAASGQASQDELEDLRSHLRPAPAVAAPLTTLTRSALKRYQVWPRSGCTAKFPPE